MLPHPQQAGSSTGPLSPAFQVPPAINNLSISMLEGSIPKTDTQHNCHALPCLDLTTQCGGDGSWDTGAWHIHKGCLQAWPQHLSRPYTSTMRGTLPREQQHFLHTVLRGQ